MSKEAKKGEKRQRDSLASKVKIFSQAHQSSQKLPKPEKRQKQCLFSKSKCSPKLAQARSSSLKQIDIPTYKGC